MPAPILVAGLIGALVQASASMAGRVAIALGVGYATYTGVSFLLDSIRLQVIGYITGMSGDLLTIAGMLKLDVVVSIIFSAYAAKLVLMGITGLGGAVTKVKLK